MRKQWHIITEGAYHHTIVCISSTIGCIPFRNDDIQGCCLDDIQNFVLMIYNGKPLIVSYGIRKFVMAKNYLLIYSENLATNIELLCQNIKASSNTLFQIRKSSSSVYANICEANYGQSKADMLSKFEIALKECNETEGWLKLLYNTNIISEEIYKNHRNLCGRIKRLLISSCRTLKESLN